MNDNMPRNTDASKGMSNVKETVREKASSLASDAKDQARVQFDQKKDVARGELDTLAAALRHAGAEVSDQGGMSGRVISTIADRIDSFGRSIEGRDLDQVMYGVERFARRNPAAFIGGAVALGFIASRFLKSSRSFDRDDFYSSEAYGGYRDYGVDAAIGSTGYGTTGGYGTTHASEFDSSREINRSSGLDTSPDINRTSALDTPSSGTDFSSGLGTAGMPDRTAGGLTGTPGNTTTGGTTGTTSTSSPNRTTGTGTRSADDLFDGGNRGRSGGR